jgi:hypothetical protein
LLHVKRFSAGAFAGAFTKTSVAPIERLKSLLQLVEGQRGLLPTVRTVLQREGVGTASFDRQKQNKTGHSIQLRPNLLHPLAARR